jgi:hypothetical protein
VNRIFGGDADPTGQRRERFVAKSFPNAGEAVVSLTQPGVGLEHREGDESPDAGRIKGRVADRDRGAGRRTPEYSAAEVEVGENFIEVGDPGVLIESAGGPGAIAAAGATIVPVNYAEMAGESFADEIVLIFEEPKPPERISGTPFSGPLTSYQSLALASSMKGIVVPPGKGIVWPYRSNRQMEICS